MSDILIIDRPIAARRLKELAQQRFGDMIKAVVDIRTRVMAVGGELHADEEALLLNKDSNQDDLWGINIYFNDPNRPFWIEYDSMVNIRPSRGNTSRDVENSEIKQVISDIVNSLIIA